MLSGNPTLNQDTFSRRHDAQAFVDDDVMTVQGTVYKTMILLTITVATAVFSWGTAMAGSTLTMPIMWGGAIGGLIVAIITVVKPQWSPTTALIYAALQGLFLGAISAFYETRFGSTSGSGNGPALNGIVAQALGLTLGVTATMLILYTTRIITVTAKLRAGIAMATGGIMLFYLVSIVLGMFGVNTSYMSSPSPLSIGISLVIVAVASFNLLTDFDMIERGAQQGAPKYMEWYGGFALLVTLVWLYLEILRLLSKLRQR